MKRKTNTVTVYKTEYIYLDCPWATIKGYFNGDMFEDWLKTPVPETDPEYKIKLFFRSRDKQVYQNTLDKIKEGF